MTWILVPDTEHIDGFLRFNRYVEDPKPRKTEIWLVANADNGAPLGYIKWYGAWRQYCFFPISNCVFHKGCLEAINRKIESLMDARRVTKRLPLTECNQSVSSPLPVE
jgi:hypothetical protein